MDERSPSTPPAAIVRVRFELFVADLDRSAGFYERALGFRAEQRAGSPAATYLPIVNGDARIGLGLHAALSAGHPLAAPLPARSGGGVELVFEVADPDAWERRAQAARAVHEPLRLRPWGLRDFRVVDPDGYYIRVTEAASAHDG